MKESEDNSLGYSAMREDPLYLYTLVDKYVKVDIIKNTTFIGFVHSIDPVTHSMILSVPKEDFFQATVIPGHAIQSISETTPAPNINPPSRKECPIASEQDILTRKKKLVAWFKKYLLPVTEEGGNLVVGTAKILPPYNSADIYAENPVVALQISSIMEKMPDDFIA